MYLGGGKKKKSLSQDKIPAHPSDVHENPLMMEKMVFLEAVLYLIKLINSCCTLSFSQEAEYPTHEPLIIKIKNPVC